jgi:hypothetical protein
MRQPNRPVGLRRPELVPTCVSDALAGVQHLFPNREEAGEEWFSPASFHTVLSTFSATDGYNVGTSRRAHGREGQYAVAGIP